MNKLCKVEINNSKIPSETQKILDQVDLIVHEAVSKITLHGSRGLAGGFRPDSDIDLTLMVDSHAFSLAQDKTALMERILSTTLENWKSPVELDLAIAYDKSSCGLLCLNVEQFDPGLCKTTTNCMGIFKKQKGFSGFVSGDFLDARKMYPLIVVWEKETI